MSYKITTTPIAGVVHIHVDRYADDRGYWVSPWNEQEFFDANIREEPLSGLGPRFTQDSESYSKMGTLRGLHMQDEDEPMGKLVRVLKGRIYDVVVDMREGSPTQFDWLHFNLDEYETEMVYIPPGCLHGFFALDDAIVLYKTTGKYDPAHETTVKWNDPYLRIRWPFSGDTPLHISEKDKNGITLESVFKEIL